MPSEAICDSQLEENTFDESASQNSLPPREQRPTRVRNEPNRLTYYAPGYSINTIGIGPAHAFPSLHNQPCYCTPYVQRVPMYNPYIIQPGYWTASNF